MSLRIYDFENYKDFINELILNMPRNGRGQYKAIANYLNLNTVVISQIFKGNRDLTLELSITLAKYFGLSKMETDYFINLVSKERASNYELKLYYEQILTSIRSEAIKVKHVIENEELTEAAKAEFYSQWFYSAIRLSTLIPGNTTAQEISQFLKLPLDKTIKTIEFLLKYGLLKRDSGELKIGPKLTHLPADSTFVSKHHSNWRLKGIERMPLVENNELFYTSPMTISTKDMMELKLLMLDLISKLSKKVKLSKDEKLVCFNLDFFEIKPKL